MTREYQEPLTASPAVVVVDADAQTYFTTGFVLFQFLMVVLAISSHIYLRRRTLQSQAAALRRGGGGGGFAAMDAPSASGNGGRGGGGSFPASLAGVGSVLANMTLSSNMFNTPTTNASPTTNTLNGSGGGTMPQQQSPSSAGGGGAGGGVGVVYARNPHQRTHSGTSLVEMTSAGSTSFLHGGDLASPTTAAHA